MRCVPVIGQVPHGLKAVGRVVGLYQCLVQVHVRPVDPVGIGVCTVRNRLKFGRNQDLIVDPCHRGSFASVALPITAETERYMRPHLQTVYPDTPGARYHRGLSGTTELARSFGTDWAD